MRKKIIRVLILAVVILAVFGAYGAYAEDEEVLIGIEAEGFNNNAALGDDNRLTFTGAQANNKITVTCEAGIRSVYVSFDQVPVNTYTITDPESGRTIEVGTNYFLHDYNNIEKLFGTQLKKVEIRFTAGAVLADVYAFHDEEPDYIQKWEPPLEKADLLLISTHSDDEQLYFAGLLPYYAVERKLDVQVAYYIQHFTVGFIHQRPHELLDGLWTVGIRNYPYFSDFPDHYIVAEGRDRQTTLNQTISDMAELYGVSYDRLLGYNVEVLRRFKPLVVVCHDLDGEYGHGAHILNAYTLCEALKICGDDTKYTDTANKYGTWTPEKVYLHLYPQNPIIMDWDTPYESLGGKTPFEVTQMGFRNHMTQQYPMFTKWIYGTEDAPVTKATDIKQYSPCEYGLYFTTVGYDVKGGDMFENVQTYSEKRAAEEEARRKAEEEARRAEEEARRAEEERKAEEARKKAEEEARKAEEERKAKEAEEARIKAEEARKMRIRTAVFAATVILAVILFIVIRRRK